VTQNDAILSALRRGERLTPRDALLIYGTSRLAARIWDLKQAGHAISERMVKVPGRDLGKRRLRIQRKDEWRDGTTCLVAEYSMAHPGELFAKAFEWT
jgi:hypothetical protein